MYTLIQQRSDLKSINNSSFHTLSQKFIYFLHIQIVPQNMIETSLRIGSKKGKEKFIFFLLKSFLPKFNFCHNISIFIFIFDEGIINDEVFFLRFKIFGNFDFFRFFEAFPFFPQFHQVLQIFSLHARFQCNSKNVFFGYCWVLLQNFYDFG